MQNKELCG